MGRKIMKNDKKNRRLKNSMTQDYENSQIDDKNDNNSKNDDNDDYDIKLEKIMIKRRRVIIIRRRVITIQQTIITRR